MTPMEIGRRVLVLAALAAVGWMANGAWAGPGCCGGPGPRPVSKPAVYGVGSSEPAKPRPPEPYHGQKRCPVCDAELGLKGPAVSVNATLTTSGKKTFWQKIGLARPSPETLSYFVCGPECAGQAREHPNTYLVTVIAWRGAGR